MYYSTNWRYYTVISIVGQPNNPSMFPVSLLPQCPICGKHPALFQSPPCCTSCYVRLHYCRFCGRVKSIDRVCWRMAAHGHQKRCCNAYCGAKALLPKQFPTECLRHFQRRFKWVGHDYCLQCGLLYSKDAQDATLLCFECWCPMVRREVFAHVSIWGLVRLIMGYCGS